MSRARVRMLRASLAIVALAGLASGTAVAATTSSPWYGSAEALWLQLNHGANGNTPVILDSVTDETLLGANDVTYPMAAGPRLVVGKRLASEGAAELVYFGLNSWQASGSVVGDNDLRIPGDLGLATLDFFNADQLTASENATINNVEANYWTRADESGLAFLTGFRYVNLDERFRISAADSDTGASRYDVATRNDLFGAQIGARYREMTAAGGRLGLETNVKAGVFGNSVGMNQFVSDSDNTFVVRNTAVGASHVAFVGDVSLVGLVRVTDSINARFGYTLMWLDGVARAANQLDFSDSAASGTSLAYGQGAFLQGVSAGFEVGW